MGCCATSTRKTESSTSALLNPVLSNNHDHETANYMSENHDHTPTNQFDAAGNGNLLWFESNKFDLDGTDSEGRTSLYIAARNGHYNITQYLVLKGANINIIESKTHSTPLHSAAYYGHGEIVQFLIGMGCDCTIRNKYNNLAYQEAKTDKIKNLILYPKRGNTERFTVNKLSLPPSFVTDSNCVVGFHWIKQLDLNMNEHEINKRENRYLIVNELKNSGDNTKVFGIELEKIYKYATDIEWYKKLILFYTLESPLYKTVNGDIWSFNKLTKYKYYCKGLHGALEYCNDNCEKWLDVCYRSVNLTYENIQLFDKYKYNKNKHCSEYVFQLPGFVSCSKSKNVCLSWGGNAILIILPHHTNHLSDDDYANDLCAPLDISKFSIFPNEQEVLFPYVNQFTCMGVKQVNYKNSKTKWEITLQISSFG